MRVTARVFVVLGGFLAALAVLYGVTSEEEAGTVMLLLSGALALFVGAYLTRSARAEPVAEGQDRLDAVEAAFLPHESVWPFWLGLAALVLGNGLALGLWGLIPGAILLVVALWGFSRQSRRRH